MHPGCAVGALRSGVDRSDPLEQGGILAGPLRGLTDTVGVVGGSGDLKQLTRTLDVAGGADVLRLDERVHVHRVSLAKKAVARLRISLSSRSRRFSARSAASSSRSALVIPSMRVPASSSACLTQARTAVSVRSKSRATW